MNIRNLLNNLAAEEAAFAGTLFLAPCVAGGSVRARVGGLVQTFRPEPQDFEGWGVFRTQGDHTAEVVEEASLPQIAEYLALLAPMRLRLACPLQNSTWLAYPVNEGDARQRMGAVRPVAVHLVTEGEAFEPILARGGGGAWWFEDLDRRADPQPTERLREALRELLYPQDLRFTGMTPEMRTAYGLAAQQKQDLYAAREREQTALRQSRDERRLSEALAVGGGHLRGYRDRGDYWQVDWTTRDGQRHTSAIGKRDLTVLSSGICLSERDHDFDLQSLVGVIEKRQWSEWD